jgi:hypothetical protein
LEFGAVTTQHEMGTAADADRQNIKYITWHIHSEASAKQSIAAKLQHGQQGFKAD